MAAVFASYIKANQQAPQRQKKSRQNLPSNYFSLKPLLLFAFGICSPFQGIWNGPVKNNMFYLKVSLCE